jgi:hypothetical protein
MTQKIASTEYDQLTTQITNIVQSCRDSPSSTPPSNLTGTPTTPTSVLPRGRGRSRASSSHLTKNIPTPISLSKTKNHKYHIIINRKGGIAAANIYFGHFNDDNICQLTQGISFSKFCLAETFNKALKEFQERYPHCLTQEHIDFMNLHAPLEAANLNNPCPKLRFIINQSPISNQAKEFTWTDNTSNDIINQFQTAALQ